MSEKGKTFAAQMAAAIWRGEKWQTRRLAKIPRGYQVIEPGTGNAWAEIHRRQGYLPVYSADPNRPNKALSCKFRPGDIMVVREPWRVAKEYDHLSPVDLVKQRGSFPEFGIHWSGEFAFLMDVGRYRQAMHLPHAFARMRRKVLAVRYERLGAISEADALAEGITKDGGWWGVGTIEAGTWFNLSGLSAEHAYTKLWEHIHGHGSWERDKDKWVEVTEFERRAGA